MISDLDKNKSGSNDFEEFLDMMTARMSDKDTGGDYDETDDPLVRASAQKQDNISGSEARQHHDHRERKRRKVPSNGN